ncbi:gamma-secretase-activating protein isoform X2 [Girardinichthys multiradiatus]|uniref:gamma-secretase-activating protein isoform X2 n=1 Tax=Girardinichthys multiradiatus TaxID=208333 RepID=UPI001FAE425A|nr:gamma-secretase-activating protein isoform X2 [Girardinichthys multiradiatus]
MLKLKQQFDLQRDVVFDILRKEASVCRVKEYSEDVDTRILNTERDGSVLYSWKGATGTTRIGKYDPYTKQNKLLYTFDKQVCVSSCSLNKEETLLAVSLVQNTSAQQRLKPISRCLTLLIEIHPINNTKVLKAVDCRVKVQFLHQETEWKSALESHLLLFTEDGYVDLYHVLLSKQEGYRVVISNPERLSRAVERIIEDFCWVQWDGHTQRLYYLTRKDRFLLRCVQFYQNHSCDTVLELVLELPANAFRAVRFVSLGFDHYHVEKPEQELVRMRVFTNRLGSMCVCYSQLLKDKQELTYTVVLVHKDCSKRFRVYLGNDKPSLNLHQLHPLFIPIGYYILVYLQGYFLHCINTRQHEMLCHSLFLTGQDVNLGMQSQSDALTVMHKEDETSVCLLELARGSIHIAELSPAYLLQILRSDASPGCPSSRTDPLRLAALHCLLVFMGDDLKLELKIIEWLCDNMNIVESFDQIQEFILASLFRMSYEKSLCLDKVLPYSSVYEKKEVPACLEAVPGVSCTTELHIDPDFKGKAERLQGFWSELQWNTEKMKYLNAVPNSRYRTSDIQADWNKLRSESRASSHLNHLEENTKKVLSMVDTWCLEKKLVPLFQEEDHQQRAFIGLTVDKLREHLNRHLPQLGNRKIDSLVVNYVAKLLELIRHMLESAWLKNKLGPHVLCLTKKGGPSEWAVFHFMLRILESTQGLCLPLPPGYHTLFAVFAVRCLPHQTFLQYIDHGFLQLTETFVSRLMTDLDNSETNERLKFSILKKLSEPMEQRIYHMWDHPVSSASISRDYVKTLLEKHTKNKGFGFTVRDKPDFRPEFLPLTYLAKMLSDIESQALNPFEDRENVDARFVEESALMQTLIQLGFEEK